MDDLCYDADRRRWTAGRPGNAGLVSHHVGDDLQGAVGLAILSGIAGAILATSLFAYFNGTAAPVNIPGIAFFAAAGLNVVALLIAWRVLSRPPLHDYRSDRSDSGSDGEAQIVKKTWKPMSVGRHGIAR